MQTPDWYKRVSKTGLSSVLRPFPGRYPTRVEIRAPDFHYFGKLTPFVLTNFRKSIAFKEDALRDVSTFEYDQNGLIEQLNGFSVNNRVSFCEYYSPAFPYLMNQLGRRARAWFWLSRIPIKVHGRWLYVNPVWETSEYKGLINTCVQNAARFKQGPLLKGEHRALRQFAQRQGDLGLGLQEEQPKKLNIQVDEEPLFRIPGLDPVRI